MTSGRDAALGLARTGTVERTAAGLTRTVFSEAGLLSAFAMRAVQVAFQPPFELRVVRQATWPGGVRCPW